MMGAGSRLARELADIAADGEAGVALRPEGDSMERFEGELRGPPGTPYEGGIFRLDIKLCGQYPFSPPQMRFKTKIWHPNISSQSGAICLDILKDAWSPALSLKTAMLSLQALLCSPEPKDPQDAVVARQYLNEPETWAETARSWTAMYAKESSKDEKLERIVEMGFPAEVARAALERSEGNVDAAVAALLGG